MRIKQKHKNEYILSSYDGNQSVWVRNFTKQTPFSIDINKLINETDKLLILKNEIENNTEPIPNIDNLQISCQKCIIVSDGYDFERKQEILSRLPPDVFILAINGALAKWNLKHKRSINYFIVNNPYKDCMLQIPTKHSYFPQCIMSSRTYHEFRKKYRGYITKYIPVPQEDYQTKFHHVVSYRIDDYRNPVCAAIGLAFRFYVRKLLLFCCDDAFADERPGAERLENNLWIYPPQRIAHNLVDSNLYWLSNQEYKVEIKDHSSGFKYKNAEYISEEEIATYFNEPGL